MTAIQGIRLASTAAGIRYAGRHDLVLVELSEGSTCAAVFTRNAFCAAPVTVAREHLAKGPVRYLLINSGNANAGTGDAGLRAARETCRLLAGVVQIDAGIEVLVAQAAPDRDGEGVEEKRLSRSGGALGREFSAFEQGADDGNGHRGEEGGGGEGVVHDHPVHVVFAVDVGLWGAVQGVVQGAQGQVNLAGPAR